jgi:hypothetical protein
VEKLSKLSPEERKEATKAWMLNLLEWFSY